MCFVVWQPCEAQCTGPMDLINVSVRLCIHANCRVPGSDGLTPLLLHLCRLPVETGRCWIGCCPVHVLCCSVGCCMLYVILHAAAWLMRLDLCAAYVYTPCGLQCAGCAVVVATSGCSCAQMSCDYEFMNYDHGRARGTLCSCH